MHLLLPETGSEGDRNFLLQERQLNFSLNLSTELISMCVFFFFFWTSCGTLDPVKHVGWSLGCVVHLWKVQAGDREMCTGHRCPGVTETLVWTLHGFCEAFPEPILEFNPEGCCWSSALVPASALTLGRAGL